MVCDMEKGSHFRLTPAAYRAFEDEIEALKHDFERYVAISAELAGEVERLRLALSRIEECSSDKGSVEVARQALAGQIASQPCP